MTDATHVDFFLAVLQEETGHRILSFLYVEMLGQSAAQESYCFIDSYSTLIYHPFLIAV